MAQVKTKHHDPFARPLAVKSQTVGATYKERREYLAGGTVTPHSHKAQKSTYGQESSKKIGDTSSFAASTYKNQAKRFLEGAPFQRRDHILLERGLASRVNEAEKPKKINDSMRLGLLDKILNNPSLHNQTNIKKAVARSVKTIKS